MSFRFLQRLAAATVIALSFAPVAESQDPTPPAKQIAWGSDLAAALPAAGAAGRPVLVFFTATWCQPCKQLLAGACASEGFAEAFANHACVLVDIDQHKELARSWQVGPIPDLRFVAASGEEIGGFVGVRDLAGILAERDKALAAAQKAAALRATVEAEPGSAGLRLELAELLLLRPNKRPGIEALQAVWETDSKDGGLAARAHWLAIAHRTGVLGRMEPATVQDAEERRRILAESKHLDAPSYAAAIESMVLWNNAMRDWTEARRGGGKEQPLSVPEAAPLRAILAKLLPLAEKAGQPVADAAADALMIDGLLHYYSGDHGTAIARLTRFTREFPQHRWHSEGVRFLGINQRLQQQRDAKR